MFKIVRAYSRPDPQSPSGHLETKKGLSLEEAQSHCRSPATSTRGKGTAKKAPGCWDWSDQYEET